MHVIGCMGFAGSGKSTVANHLVQHHGFTKLSFAAALKDVVAALFHWDRVKLEGRTPEDRAWREIPDPFWSEKMGRPWTPRWALQYVGTEVVRNTLHRDMWVNRVAVQLASLGPDAKVVFDDARFLNELATIRQFNGRLVVLDRPDVTTDHHRSLWDAAFFAPVPPTTVVSHLHASETEWLTEPTLRHATVLKNTGDMPALYRLVDAWYASLT